jgi:hypothetical protein
MFSDALISAVIGLLATPLALLLKRYTDKLRPSVRLALRVLPYVDQDIMAGRITEHSVHDIALGYVQEFADEGVSPALIERAAKEAVERLSLTVLDQKIAVKNLLG